MAHTITEALLPRWMGALDGRNTRVVLAHAPQASELSIILTKTPQRAPSPFGGVNRALHSRSRSRAFTASRASFTALGPTSESLLSTFRRGAINERSSLRRSRLPSRGRVGVAKIGRWPLADQLQGVQERERAGICLLVSNASCLERRTSRLADAAGALRLIVNLDMNAARCIEGELKD